MATETKPNCYDCRWRRNLPGSAHSACHHPSNKKALSDPLNQLAAIFGGVGRIAPVSVPSEQIKVVGHPTGVRRGWFQWPFNFDPTWLQECSGFEAQPAPATKAEGGAHDGNA